MKSFIEPGNTLRLLKASNTNRGLVTIDEERDYRFLYTLKDVFGNTSKYSFTVRGRKQPLEPLQHREKYFFAWDKDVYKRQPEVVVTATPAICPVSAWSILLFAPIMASDNSTFAIAAVNFRRSNVWYPVTTTSARVCAEGCITIR